jgi:hypothetical protein
MNTPDLKVLGDQAFTKAPKVSADLLSLTYGSIVAQIVAENESVEEANTQLEAMGRRIGVRLVEEFLARSGVAYKCKDFVETCEVIAKVFVYFCLFPFFFLSLPFFSFSFLSIH